MKHLFIIFMGIMCFLYTGLSSFHEGRQYISLEKKIDDVPQILEFFSFYCPHCYQFEEVYHISSNLNKMLPRGINIVKYHVGFLGKLGEQLTKAWAIALVLGIEDKFSSLMFFELHNKNAINTESDIRSIFSRSGVTDQEYDIVSHSIQVKSLILKQKQLVFDFQLRGVPAIFVNGKYMIKNDGLDTSSMDAYIRQCSNVIQSLIGKI